MSCFVTWILSQVKMDLETKKFYLKIFTSIDEDVNGYLSDREFKKFLISCDIPVNNRSVSYTHLTLPTTPYV